MRPFKDPSQSGLRACSPAPGPRLFSRAGSALVLPRRVRACSPAPGPRLFSRAGSALVLPRRVRACSPAPGPRLFSRAGSAPVFPRRVRACFPAPGPRLFSRAGTALVLPRRVRACPFRNRLTPQHKMPARSVSHCGAPPNRRATARQSQGVNRSNSSAVGHSP